MHIAIFVDFHDSSVGGVQTSVRGQRQGLEALGHTVTVVSPPPLGGSTHDDAAVCIPAVPLFRPNGFPMVMPSQRNRERIERALDARDPIDIIHAQTNMGVGMLGVQIAHRRSLPLVQTMHGRDDVFASSYPLPYVTTAIQRYLHKQVISHNYPVHRLQDTPTAHNAWQIMVNHAQAANHVIMPSRHFADKFRDHGVTRPMSVISNGIKDDVIARLPTKKRRASRKKTPFKVMWCGRVSQEKRPIDSIRAIAKLKNCTLDIYGDGPMLGEVKKYVHAHGLKDRVRVLGRVEQVEILDAMQTHDVLLYPSYGFDNQPMVLIEAVAAAIPIIYCDPDLTECMPEAGGLLTDDASIDAISLALSEVQHEPNRWQKMHETLFAYRGKVAQSYHSKKMAATYKKIISGR